MLGRVVIYKTTKADRDLMGSRKNCEVRNDLPATIVAINGKGIDSSVNLRVHVDGFGPDLWRVRIEKGLKEGQWKPTI